MKVLAAVVVAPHAKISGAVTAAKELSAALKAYCDISLAVMAPEDGCESFSGMPIQYVRGRLPFEYFTSHLPNKFKVPFYRSNLPSLVQSGSYDLVHLHNPVPALELSRIAQACIQKRVPYVVSTHGFVEISGGGRGQSLSAPERVAFRYLIRNPVRKVVRDAAGVLVFSPADVPIVNEFGGGGLPSAVAPNGVHSPLPRSPERLAALRAQYGLENNAEIPVVLYLGSHAPNKGLSILLQAALASQQKFTLLVGGEKRPHIDYEGALSRLKDGQRIIFLGHVSDDAVPEFYQIADIFTFPSLADTFPLVVLEAMSHGLAIVASRVGGVPFQLSQECGIIVDPGNPQALKTAMDTLITNPQLRSTLGAQAKQRAREKFSWSSAAAEAYRLYQIVTNRTVRN